MPLVLRNNNGGLALTYTQLDGNFTYLDGRIDTNAANITTNTNNISKLITSASRALVTASVDLTVTNKVTFTKGDGSTFFITVGTGSAAGFVTTSSFNAFTSSVVTTSSFNAFTSSVVTTSSFNNFTGSVITTGSQSARQSITGSLIISGSNFSVIGLQTSSTTITNVLMLNGSGQVFVTASSAFGGGPSTNIKASSASISNFTGTPLIAGITFGSAFSNDLYSVTVTGTDARIWTIQNKSNTGFTINSNSSVGLTGPVFWVATAFNN